MRRGCSCVLLLAPAALAPATASADMFISTSFGIGADAEVRDHQPTTNFGASTELATRIVDNLPEGHANDGNDRFSAMYLKFELTGASFPTNTQALVRLTFRNTNLTANRLTDTTPPGNNTAFRTGLAFYALDRDNAGNNWSESTITYANAPGIASDGDNGTKDYDFVDPDGNGPLRAPLSPLGAAVFPALPPQNRLPVGGEMLFSSTALNTFVQTAINAGKPSLTIVAAVAHDGKVPVNDWKNFNYLFNPKEQTTLTTDTGYDADINNPNNPLGSPFSGASNAENANGFSPFSPQLILDAPLRGDFNSDASVNAVDIDLLCDAIDVKGPPDPFDLNGDGSVDDNDLSFQIEKILNTKFGDTDTDGDVDLADLGNLASGFGQPGEKRWSRGNFDCDNDVDLADLGTLATNFQAGRAAAFAEFEALVPEPGSAAILGLAAATLSTRRRHRTGSPRARNGIGGE